MLHALRSEVALPQVPGGGGRFSGGRFEVACCDRRIVLHAESLKEHPADEIHRRGIAAIGGEVSPAHRRGVVLRNAFAIAIAIGQGELSADVAFCGLGDQIHIGKAVTTGQLLGDLGCVGTKRQQRHCEGDRRKQELALEASHDFGLPSGFPGLAVRMVDGSIT